MVCGIQVFESFQNVSSDGLVPVPQSGEKLLGGHAIVLVGFDESKQLVEFRNSWGDGWGDYGYGWLPYAYFDRDSVTCVENVLVSNAESGNVVFKTDASAEAESRTDESKENENEKGVDDKDEKVNEILEENGEQSVDSQDQQLKLGPLASCFWVLALSNDC